MPHPIIVLVRPRHPGNVGAVARAMMNFGFSRLRLVAPEFALTDTEALQRAVHAKTILASAKIYDDLLSALADDTRGIGTTRLNRHTPLNHLSLPELAIHQEHWQDGKTALIFGPENDGLSTEEIKLCDWVIHIPSHAEFPSLNLSHAVIVVLYEWTRSCGKEIFTPAAASIKQKEEFYAHLQEALLKIEFLDPQNPERIMRDLRNLLGRRDLNTRELKILRALARKIINRASQ